MIILLLLMMSMLINHGYNFFEDTRLNIQLANIDTKDKKYSCDNIKRALKVPNISITSANLIKIDELNLTSNISFSVCFKNISAEREIWMRNDMLKYNTSSIIFV